MKTVETREFRANLANMLKMAANTPVLLDRGRKGLILFTVALNPLKSLANSSNVMHMRDFRNNMASYLDQAGERLLFIRNSDKVLLQIIEIPKQYVEDCRKVQLEKPQTPVRSKKEKFQEPKEMSMNAAEPVVGFPVNENVPASVPYVSDLFDSLLKSSVIC